MGFKISVAATTDIGRKRENNEDAFRVLKGLGLYIVADGLGGHAAGEVASNMAADRVVEYLRLHRRSDHPLMELLTCAIEAAHTKVAQEARSNRQYFEMGTTVVALLHRRDQVHIVHVGDSPCYRFREDKLERLTKDHHETAWLEEEIEKLVAKGEVVPEWMNRMKSRYGNILTRNIGGRDAHPDLRSEVIKTGDRYLLCSDGLNGMISEDRIQQILAESVDVDVGVKALLQAALEAGGRDNITLILLQFT